MYEWLELTCKLETCKIDGTKHMEIKKCFSNEEEFSKCPNLEVRTREIRGKGDDIWKKLGDVIEQSKLRRRKDRFIRMIIMSLFILSCSLMLSCAQNEEGERIEEEVVENRPPEAIFSYLPPIIGGENTTFDFDASKSQDPEGEELTYRWDWESDGTWDYGPVKTSTATHKFTFDDTYETTYAVSLEAMNANNGCDQM